MGTEVNNRENGRFDLNDQNLVDLSIETNSEKLSNETKNTLPAYFPWFIYAAGLLLIAAAVFDFESQKVAFRTTATPIQNSCHLLKHIGD